MVLQKMLDYGFNGYQVPPTPRAARSARKRVSFRKKLEDKQAHAFDLLAIVAGELLLERENTSSFSNKSVGADQCVVVNNIVKSHDQESSARSFFVSELSQAQEQNLSSKESTQNDLNLGLASPITTSDCAGRFNSEKLVNRKSKNEIKAFANEVQVGSSGSREYGDCKVKSKRKRLMKDDLHESGKVLNSTVANLCSLEDPIVWTGKPPALVNSNSRPKVPLCRDHIPHSSYPANRDVVNVVCRDDDEKPSGCTHPSTLKKFFRPEPLRIGDRRIRKILASKYWKAAPRWKDGTLSNRDGYLKPVYPSRKNHYKHERSERIYPFKKRKHFEYCLPSNSDGGISSEFISDSTKKSNDGDISGSYLKIHGASGASSSVVGQPTSFQCRDSHVKLRIKSFRVPELFFEVPENATIGLLKKTVMDAVTAITGGEIHIGVLLQGKKIRDDNKTLLQTGISHNNQLDALGFSLEPNPSQAPSLCPTDSPFLLPCDSPQPLSRYPPTPCGIHQGTSCAASTEPHVTNLGNFIESDHDSSSTPTDMSTEKCMIDAKALVSTMNVDALSVVPVQQKSKLSEIVQRRIRRPFSVAEVEALVQAVEKLGTGRWRDVKLRAFDHVKHRTYVDLKDKWKTLVHTARISPQQRRGEPVPQELLDRVLSAQAYWSQQQAKHQLKQQQLETCLLP